MHQNFKQGYDYDVAASEHTKCLYWFYCLSDYKK